MKVIGEKQFTQKKFKFLDMEGSDFEGILGKIPRNFLMVVCGASGNGKTEFALSLSMELRKFGKVGWWSYEQGHGADLQMAHARNFEGEYDHPWLPIDPYEGKPDGVTLLQEMEAYLDKRNSPQFNFIDSLDYTGFSFDDYKSLKRKYGKRKSFVFIVKGSKSCRVKKSMCDAVYFDGQIGIHVIDYIATPDKNRFGGTDPYVIYEEEAKKRNPLFFTKRDKVAKPSKKDTSETLAPAKDHPDQDQTELKLVK